jgi:hypothetical protein
MYFVRVITRRRGYSDDSEGAANVQTGGTLASLSYLVELLVKQLKEISVDYYVSISSRLAYEELQADGRFGESSLRIEA